MEDQARQDDGGTNLKEDVNTELDRLGQGGRWVW